MRRFTRQMATVLAWIGLGAIPLVLADPPSSTPAAATAPSAAASSTATPPAATPAAAPAKSASDIDPREKMLLNMGFKPRMHNGQKLYCKREMELGSRVEGTTHCGTVDQLASEYRLSREAVEQSQRYGTNPRGG